jgi:hypothetical protein
MGLRRHALQPESLDGFAMGLVAIGVLQDQAEDELAFAPRVAGVDDGAHVLALDEPDDGVQARLGLVDGCHIEVRWHHRQLGEAPLAALDVVVFRRLDLHQMTHGGGHHVVVVLEVVGVLFEFALAGCQRAHDVLRHAGLFRDDDRLAHVSFWARGARRLARMPCGPCLQSAGLARTHARSYDFNVPNEQDCANCPLPHDPSRAR